VIATAAAFGALPCSPAHRRMAVGDPNAAVAVALTARPGVPRRARQSRLWAAARRGRAAAEHRTRLSFLRDERDT